MLFNPSTTLNNAEVVEDICSIVDLLETEKEVFVVFCKNSDILYKGDLQHCYAYALTYNKWIGYMPNIYSIEKYNELFGKD